MFAQVKKITLAVALGASALAISAPADAQRYGGYRGRDDGGAALAAGVAGLAIGAALASSANRRDDSYYYDQEYNRPVVVYQQGYNGYYDSRYRGYDHDRGYNGYYADHRGDYDRGRDYGDYGRGGDRYRR